jgi:pyruvate formate lyase activating enzyme
MTSGRIFNVQRFSLHDGPGIRTTVFFKGCPARCPWCHNPESQSFEPELIVLESRCIACGACRSVCPHGDAALAPPADRRAAGCDGCGRCVSTCPAAARQVAGRIVTAAEVMTEIRKDRVFFDDSGGGVTFSGGEPLAQPELLRASLELCRAEAIHTAVDTCGWGATSTLLALAPLVDLFLFDVKQLDEERHLACTGLPLAPILANLRALAGCHRAIWLRVPVIPGYTDDFANLRAVAELARSLSGIERVSLLPYHATAAAKLVRLGKPHPLAGTGAPSIEAMDDLSAIVRVSGLPVVVGG